MRKYIKAFFTIEMFAVLMMTFYIKENFNLYKTIVEIITVFVIIISFYSLLIVKDDEKLNEIMENNLFIKRTPLFKALNRFFYFIPLVLIPILSITSELYYIATFWVIILIIRLYILKILKNKKPKQA